VREESGIELGRSAALPRFSGAEDRPRARSRRRRRECARRAQGSQTRPRPSPASETSVRVRRSPQKGRLRTTLQDVANDDSYLASPSRATGSASSLRDPARAALPEEFGQMRASLRLCRLPVQLPLARRDGPAETSLYNEREIPLSSGRPVPRLPASAKTITRTTSRGTAISKAAATRIRTRMTSLPSPMSRVAARGFETGRGEPMVVQLHGQEARPGAASEQSAREGCNVSLQETGAREGGQHSPR
jgi:hypothetical protein